MRYFLLTLLLFSLSACVAGFEPVYGKKDGTKLSDVLNQVKFQSTSGRSGQVLYTALYERLKTSAENETPVYLFKVTDLQIDQSNISIAADGTARLNQVLVIGSFSLLDAKDYTEIDSFRLRLVSTYNVRNIDAYSSEIAFISARDRLLYDMAEQAKLRLVDILSRRNH